MQIGGGGTQLPEPSRGFSMLYRMITLKPDVGKSIFEQTISAVTPYTNDYYRSFRKSEAPECNC